MKADDDKYRPFYEEMGRRVRDARLNRRPKISQEVLGQIVGLTRTSITNLEKGRQKCLVHTLSSIANALQIDIKSLIPNEIMKDRNKQVDLKDKSLTEQEWILSTLKAADHKGSGNGA